MPATICQPFAFFAHTRMKRRVKTPLGPSYVPVHVTTADGKTVDGVLLNEDSYSIQMIGNDNQLHLFERARLRRILARHAPPS